ncbi:MAG: EF-hand domain-containing protein [Alphaproteobacteria bacterium]
MDQFARPVPPRFSLSRPPIAMGLALIIIAALSAGDALAQAFPAFTPIGGGNTLFQRLDRDKDGVISRAEFMQHRDDQFAMLDKNHDGVIDHEEYMAVQGPRGTTMSPQTRAMREARFRRINTSGSGKISKAEWDAESERLFNALDANKDGRITPEELRGPMHHLEP